MEALTELCDLVAQNPVLFADKLAWICSRCPPAAAIQPSETGVGSVRVTRSHLNALIALARFLSKCSDLPAAVSNVQSTFFDFLSALPFVAFRLSFWPQSFSLDSISVFFSDLLRYLSIAADISPSFGSNLSLIFGSALVSAAASIGDDTAIARTFLTAAAQSCPPISAADAERLVVYLIEQFIPDDEDASSSGSENTMSWGSSSLSKGKVMEDDRDVADDGSSEISSVQNGCSVGGRSSAGSNGGCGGGGSDAFQVESVEGLEKLEIAFRLFRQLLDRVGRIKAEQMQLFQKVAAKQLKSVPSFLKTRKRDWKEQGPQLKARIIAKLSCCRAAIELQSKCILSLDPNGKASKDALRRTLALLLDAAETCIISSWRKLKICEDLFSTLLYGINQITFFRGGQLLRVLLIPLKPLVLSACAQADMLDNYPGAMLVSITRLSCEIVEFGWSKDRALVDTFIMGLAACIRERNDYEEQDVKEKQAVPTIQYNLIRLLADLSVSVNKWEVVDMILPLLIESLEEGDASSPSLLRLRLLDAISQLACLGFEKSYRETVVLMTRSYLDKVKNAGNVEIISLPSEAATERVETLPAGFLLVASRLASSKLRGDYRHRLLSLCSDVGLASETNNGRSGADFLGPLLPAVAEICSDFDPTTCIEPSLLKLFRNLWFYIVLFGLAPTGRQNQFSTKGIPSLLSNAGSAAASPLQSITGPHTSIGQWFKAVQRIAQGTPPLVVSSVKWLEDELELNALHNPGSRRGSSNEKAVVGQRSVLSATLGGRVEVAAMTTISGVKATYLLAVTVLEIIRFSCNGGILPADSTSNTSRSAFSCVFKYLLTPNLTPSVFQCLKAIVYNAAETAVAWLEERISDTGKEADMIEQVLSVHTCFLIKNMSQRDENIRGISVNLLIQFKEKFQQVLWNFSCLDALLFSVRNELPSAQVNDPALVATVRSLYQKIVREWITTALSHAPCTTQGLLQEFLCKLNGLQKTQHASDIVSLLSEIRICSGKNDCWSGIRTANIPAVIEASAAASGEKKKVSEGFVLEVLSTAVVSATMKCNHAGEIAGMRRLYNNIGGFHVGMVGLGTGPPQSHGVSFNEILLAKFVQLLQQFVGTAEKGVAVDKSLFRETCSQATALLLSHMASESRLKIEGFSQLLRLLCWCPAYISTPDAMETGIFIWTWLVSSAPSLGPLVVAELVDAWLWTIDTKRGLFASEMRYSGPAAKLRPHLMPGEPEPQPEKDAIEGLMAHRLWLGFFIDRFEVVRHDSMEQLLLFSRMLQGTMKSPFHFSQHPAATGTFFSAILLGLKFCSCKSQSNLQNCKMGLQLLEDRVFRASLGWFACEPEWY